MGYRRPERLTIDRTVARDYGDAKRDRHPQAVQLFELAKQGLVELALASSAYIVDFQGGAELRAMLEAESVLQATLPLAYPGAFYPGSTYPGTGLPSFRAAWETVRADWKTHEGKLPEPADSLHVESHVLERRDVFITDDRALLAMCHRLRDEHGIALKAMTLEGYLDCRCQLERIRSG